MGRDNVRSIIFIIFGFILTFYIFSKIKKKILSEVESLLWVFASIIIILLSIFPGILDRIAIAIGIKYPPALLFLLGILILFFLTIRQEEKISVLNERIKRLAQYNALNKHEIEELQKKLGERSKNE